MNLPFSTRSRFFSALEQALSRLGDDFPSEIRVVLGPRGYERDVHVTVRRDDPHTFETDWESRQPSRFSARIRAAATVLQRRGYDGTFRISHRDGVLVIQPIRVSIK